MILFILIIIIYLQINHKGHYMYRILILLTVLTMILPSSFAQDEPDKVKIQILPFLVFAPYYIADAEGYYDEYNIDLEIVEFDNSASAVPALIQGELDVMLGYLNFGAVNALDRGANLKIVAGLAYDKDDPSCEGSGFFISNQMAESIQSPQDLEGRTVYLQAGIPEYYLDVLLQEADLTIKDVVLDYVPPSARFEGLLSGSIEFTQLNEPWYTRVLLNEAGQEFADLEDIIPDAVFSLVTFSESMLEREDVATRFLIATQKGMQKYSEGPTEENLDIVAEFTGLDRELLEQVCWRGVSLVGEGITDNLDPYLQWALEREFIDAIPEVDTYFDGTFMEAINEAMSTQAEEADDE